MIAWREIPTPLKTKADMRVAYRTASYFDYMRGNINTEIENQLLLLLPSESMFRIFRETK